MQLGWCWGGKCTQIQGGRKLDDIRYIRETGTEARIAGIIAPVAADLGYDLVRVKILQENGCTLQIMAETPDGRFSIADCERLSREINPVLDVEDPIQREYHLEVSSPGIDRPLVRARDYARWLGHEARIELSDMRDGRRRFRGELIASTEHTVTIRLPDIPEGGIAEFELELSQIADAKLLMTDALLEAARLEQEQNNPLDDPQIETVEDTSEETN